MEPDGEEGEGQDDADHGEEGQDPPTKPLNQVHASKYSLMQYIWSHIPTSLQFYTKGPKDDFEIFILTFKSNKL